MRRGAQAGAGILASLLAVFAPRASPTTAGELGHRTEREIPVIVVDWPRFHFDNASTGFNPNETILSPSNVSDLVPAWITNVGKVTSSPAVVDGLVYVGSNGPGLAEADLTALDAGTGAVVWKRTTHGGTAFSPTVWNGFVYLGTLSDHTLRAFDSATGVPKWSFTGAGSMGAPVIDHRTLFVPSNSGIVYALNPRNGAKKWQATGSGGILAASLAVAEKKVFSVSNDGTLHAFDQRTGATVWEADIGDQTAGVPAVSGGTVYIGGGELSDALFAFDAATGALKWSVSAGSGLDSSPSVAYETVFISSNDGVIHAYDAETGTEKWAVPTGGSLTESPAVANGVVYVGASDTEIWAVDVTSGAVLWTYVTADSCCHAGAVANGVFYIGSLDENLYAFHLAG